jgi:hypothetical protein
MKLLLAFVVSVENAIPMDWSEPASDLVTDLPETVIHFGQVHIISNLNIRDYIGGLDFLSNREFWGVYPQGGCRLFSGKYVETLVSGTWLRLDRV